LIPRILVAFPLKIPDSTAFYVLKAFANDSIGDFSWGNGQFLAPEPLESGPQIV
jgi:hypothetical protein